MALDFIEAYRKTLTESLQEAGEGIANGNCTDFAEYRYKVGFRRGIQHAQFKFQDIVKQYVLEESEDE